MPFDLPILNIGNNAVTTINDNNNVAEGDDRIKVTDITVFPDPPFRVTIDTEIMEVGDVDVVESELREITRGVEGTAATTHADGSTVSNFITAGLLERGFLGNISEHNLDEVSPADGYYVRFSIGMQVCWHSITLEKQVDVPTSLSKQWNFPKSFVGKPHVSFLIDEHDFTPARTNITITRAFRGVASTTIYLHRISGAPDFVEGDTATAYVLAVGRWSST